jgi:hypothetical protein
LREKNAADNTRKQTSGKNSSSSIHSAETIATLVEFILAASPYGVKQRRKEAKMIFPYDRLF